LKTTRRLLGSKIHRATVTDANIEYEGSVTTDANLLDAAYKSRSTSGIVRVAVGSRRT